MKKSSNMNSGCNLCPPDSSVFRMQSNTIGCLSWNSGIPFPGFEFQKEIPLGLNLDLISQLNLTVFNFDNSVVGPGASSPTKRFLIFNHFGDKRSLLCNSLVNSFQTVNPTPPASKATYAFASDCHAGDQKEDIHEDTEDINALLYSDSESSYDSEVASTGHSPLYAEEEEEEEVASCPNHSKRRRLDLSLKASDYDESGGNKTVSPAKDAVFSPKFIFNDKTDLSYIDFGNNMEVELRHGNKSFKRENIRTFLNVLRRLIPGGDALDTPALFDEAIGYLKSLRLQANAVDATNESIKY